MENLKTFDKWINNNNASEDIIEIVKVMRPHWSNTTIKQLEAGEVNHLFVCHNNNLVQDDNSIIFRIHNDMREGLYFSAKLAIKVMRKASAAGLCGKVLATFSNGTVLQYLPGRTLKWNDMENPHILRLCAETVADFHSLDWKVGDLDNAQNQREVDAVLKQPAIFLRMCEALNGILDHTDDPAVIEMLHSELWQKEELSAELNYVSELVQKLNMPILFAHTDVHINNLIYDEKKGLIPEDAPPASTNQIKYFLQIYLKRRFGIVKNDPQYAKLLKKYLYQVKAFISLNSLYWSSTLQLSCLSEDAKWAKRDLDYRRLASTAKRDYLEGREGMIKLLSDLAEFDGE